MTPKHSGDPQSLKDAIFYGGSTGIMSPLSPPWGDELSCVELNSVTKFVTHLRDDPENALKMLKSIAPDEEGSKELGRVVFETRCALCHGESGQGDGKMAKIIKDPPPFNLTQSVVPDNYLRLIITGGGAPIGRSPQMPPWQDELTATELDSVITYVKTLRN